MPPERCAWKGCRAREIELTYLRKPLCARHWERLCELLDEGREAEARQRIGLPPRPVRPAARCPGATRQEACE
jgi:hypothetical protein